jgi:hypothetical protein
VGSVGRSASTVSVRRRHFWRPRPTIGPGASAAHQHRSLTVAQAVSLEERLDGLLVVKVRAGSM